MKINILHMSQSKGKSKGTDYLMTWPMQAQRGGGVINPNHLQLRR